MPLLARIMLQMTPKNCHLNANIWIWTLKTGFSFAVIGFKEKKTHNAWNLQQLLMTHLHVHFSSLSENVPKLERIIKD